MRKQALTLALATALLAVSCSTSPIEPEVSYNSKSADTIVSSMENARPQIEKYIADIFEMAAEMR